MQSASVMVHNPLRQLHHGLTLCMLSIFLPLLLSDFYKINFLKIILQEYYQSDKRLGSRSGLTLCCFRYSQRLSARDKFAPSRQRGEPSPAIFCPENVVCFYVCCIYSIALQTRFHHGRKPFEPFSDCRSKHCEP